MSKFQDRVSLKKCFEFDLKNILMSDSSNGEDNEREESVACSLSKRRKIFSSPNKNESISGEPENLGLKEQHVKHNMSDVSCIVGNLEKEFDQKTAMKRNLLNKFTRAIIEIHQVKYVELIRKQDTEIKHFKNQFLNEVASEIEKWQTSIYQIKEEEDKIMKMLNQLRTLYNSSEIHQKKVTKVAEIHKYFAKKYEGLLKKHKSESTTVKIDINNEMSRIKNEFLTDLGEIESGKLDKISDDMFLKDMNYINSYKTKPEYLQNE